MRAETKRSSARLAVAILALTALAACGFRVNTRVRSEQVWSEVRTGGFAARRPAPTSKPAAPPKRGAVVAVFDIEDRGAGISPPMRERLSAYLAMTLAAATRLQVVPRSQLKKRLAKQKRDSYRKCYDRSCQIEIGRELAAQKTLSTAIIKVGTRCTVTAVLFDLRSAASQGGGTAEGACGDEAIAALIKKVVKQLGGKL